MGTDEQYDDITNSMTGSWTVCFLAILVDREDYLALGTSVGM